MSIRIESATLDDVLYVARNLRPEDAEEVRAATGESPEEYLVAVFDERDVAALHNEDGPFALCGVYPDLQNIGACVGWLLATPGVSRSRLSLLRGAREFLRYLGSEYEVLHNYVDARNEAHIRWLQLLGARFGASIFVRGELFRHFTIHLGGRRA